MNYIKRMQQEVNTLKREVADRDAMLAELRRYLHSAKFRADTTVQTADIFARTDIGDYQLHAQRDKEQAA